MGIKTNVRLAAVVVFGAIFPALLMVEAYVGISKLNGTISAAVSKQTPTQMLTEVRPYLRNGNDFALFAMMSSERANEVVMVNKQIMKVVVMQIGFAVASIGLMFVILGISDGGATVGAGAATWKFDFKTGSTGALVFAVGAAMATAGGVLRNEYTTVPVPAFAVDVDDGRFANFYAELAAQHVNCAKFGASAGACFYQVFDQLDAEMKK